MSLSGAYAQIIIEAEREKHPGFAEKLLSFMKARGHLSLLPAIVKLIERAPESSDISVLTVASQGDEKKYSKEIATSLKAISGGKEEFRTVIDPRIVGGYSLRAGSKSVDKSFRSALVDLYQKAVRS